MKNFKQLLLLSFLVLITLNLWVLSKQSSVVIIEDPIKSITQASALLGTVFLGFELIMISRAKWLEAIIGPLDKLYKYHREIGVFSVVALTLHSSTLIINALPNEALAKLYIIPKLSNLTYSAGIVAFYLFLSTSLISLYLKLPYHIWKMVHRILGFSTILAAYHVLTISSDVSNPILKFWVLGILFTGILAMLYKIFAYSQMASRYEYQIAEVDQRSEVTLIKMQPLGKFLKFQSGQFAYFSFESADISKEEHPFSIASSPNSSELIIAVKRLGDYTNEINNVHEGDKVTIRGPHGCFGKKLGQYENEVWICAGIGVTPFLSFDVKCNTNMIYCTRNKFDRFLWAEIMQKQCPQLNIINYQSEKHGRIRPEDIQNLLTNPKNTAIRICGPRRMIEGFKSFFETQGFPMQNLFYEEFNFFG